MVEKRAAKRSPIELAASYGIEEDLRPAREAKIDNISSGGFCFTSSDQLKVGKEIELSIDLDTVEEVILTVEIIWIKRTADSGKHTIGVQIVDRESPDFDRFVKFYNTQL